MSNAIATIREIRTDFRSVKRKVEEHGEVVITDNGVPRFLLKSLPPPPPGQNPLPDYHARLLAQRAQPISERETRKLHEENRGHR
jgi:hypothetical protein